MREPIDLASSEGLGLLVRQITEALTLRDSIKIAASWFGELIDQEMASYGRPMANRRDFCLMMSEESEAWRSEEAELRAWAWLSAAEVLDLYEENSRWTDRELVEFACAELDDPAVVNREAYFRHLVVSALSYLHGWVHVGSG